MKNIKKGTDKEASENASILTNLTEKVVTRLHPVGRKGFSTLKNHLQIWDGDRLLAEADTAKKAYRKAKQVLKSKKNQHNDANIKYLHR